MESTNLQKFCQPSHSRETSLRKIGAGACGAIFGRDGQPVFKLAKTDDDMLWNDYVMHALVVEVLEKHGIIGVIQVPACYIFNKGDPDFFRNNPELVKKATGTVNLPTRVLVTERIPPLPQKTREAIIEKYCHPNVKKAALVDPANRDCLVRAYLGAIAPTGGTGRFFSLRNFKLYLGQMIELDLDICRMAAAMGATLAGIHWAARTDARDVEFVLAPSRELTAPDRKPAADIKSMKQNTSTGPEGDKDLFCGPTELWLLDFNLVRCITMDEAGVDLAVEVFKLNDPYYPRPLGDTKAEKKAWEAFAEEYKATAARIGVGDRLPGLFLERVEEMQRGKKERVARRTEGTPAE